AVGPEPAAVRHASDNRLAAIAHTLASWVGAAFLLIAMPAAGIARGRCTPIAWRQAAWPLARWSGRRVFGDQNEKHSGGARRLRQHGGGPIRGRRRSPPARGAHPQNSATPPR